MDSSYAISTWLFTRALGLIYLFAFLSLAFEARALWGPNGVSPMADYLQTVERATGSVRYWDWPSLFWFDSSNSVLTLAAWAGVLASLGVVLGFGTGWCLLFCFAMYLSFVSAGQEFMSFQWDSLLLEVGFVSLFAVSWQPGWSLALPVEPHWIVRALFYVILFKLMFLSGVVKLQSGDPSWRDLTALSYHYWTQPLPNPLSPFMHALPGVVHRISAGLTFVIELGAPFALFWPAARPFAALGFVGLSLLIFVTGNYTFFNLLTIALCLWAVPDHWWQPLVDRLGLQLTVLSAPTSADPFVRLIAIVLTGLSVFWCLRALAPGMAEEWVNPLLRWTQPLRISNPYGLFAVMTKTRSEIIIEGSLDGVDWREYEFKYKPGALHRAPPVIEPLQPRLDWQMWFAALGNMRQNPWLLNLFRRLFEGADEVKVFFRHNPFPDQPPRYLRARLYDYEFAPPMAILREGRWWERRLTGEYTPTFERR